VQVSQPQTPPTPPEGHTPRPPPPEQLVEQPLQPLVAPVQVDPLCDAEHRDDLVLGGRAGQLQPVGGGEGDAGERLDAAGEGAQARVVGGGPGVLGGVGVGFGVDRG